MPFQKGREKTGGRKKGGPSKKTTKLVDQLKDYGFNYPRELAKCLKALPDTTKYFELKQLLPFMAPKLREREVELADQIDVAPTPAAISTNDLLKALENGTDKQSKPRTSRPDPVATGSAELQTKASSETDLYDVAKEQGDN